MLPVFFTFSVIAVHSVFGGTWTYRTDTSSSCTGNGSDKCGPLFWGNIAPACSSTSTSKQSPINLANAVVDEKITHPLFLAKEGGCDSWVQFTDDHAFEVSFEEHGCNNLGLTYSDEYFNLKQIHIHSTSEHTLYGNSFDAEAHFVHKSSNGKILVLGVFLTTAHEKSISNIFDKFWGVESGDIVRLEKDLSTNGGLEVEVNAPLNPYAELLPEIKNFFSYSGSLTTPPCTEGVQWLVYEQPVEISKQDIYNLRTFVAFNSITIIAQDGNDNRPLQEQNGRIIKKYMDQTQSSTGGASFGFFISSLLGVAVALTGLVFLWKCFHRRLQYQNLDAEPSKGKLLKGHGSSASLLTHTVNLDMEEGDLSYDELQNLVLKRKELGRKSFDEGIKIVWGYSGTILRFLLWDFQLWSSFILYFACRWYLKVHTTLPVVPLGPVSAIGGFVSFLLVYYASQTYTRMITLYSHSCGLKGRIVEAVMIANTNMHPSAAMRFCRHMNAAHILAYTGFNETYTRKNFFDPLNRQWRLLTEKEVERLDTIGFVGAGAVREVMQWMFNDIHAEFVAGRISDAEKLPIVDQVVRFRYAVAQLYDFADLPFPHIYVHFVYLVTIIYPALFAVTVALSFRTNETYLTHEVIMQFCVFINSAFVIGIRGIAKAFHDPYGNDLEDLSVPDFVKMTIGASFKLLYAAPVDPLDESVEAQLQDDRPFLGAGYADEQLKVSAAAAASLIKLKPDVFRL